MIDQIPDIEALKSALNDYEGVRLDLKFQHSNIKQFVGNFTYKKQVRKFEVLNAIRYLNKNEDTELKEWVMGQLANMKSNYDDIYVYIRQQLDY